MKRKRSLDNHQEVESSRVCRDFLRNVCTRRDTCKFTHVIPSVQFCHDFQNTGTCARKHCKYTHGTSEDERFYLANGTLPEHLKPVCLNYLKNKCTRALCKFLHPPRPEDFDTNENNDKEKSSSSNGELSPHHNGSNGQHIQKTVGSQPPAAPCNGEHSLNPEEAGYSHWETTTNQPPHIPTQAKPRLGEERKKSKKAAKMHEVKAIRNLLAQENEFLKMKLHEMGQHLVQLQSNIEYLTEENQRLKQEAQHNTASRITTLEVQHSATGVTALAVPHSATNVTHLAVPHSSSMAIAVPQSASVTALAVPHSATNVTHLAVPHSSSMAIAVPQSASVTALAVPHSSSMAIAVPQSASVTALAVPHSATNVTHLAVPHSSSMAIAVPQSASVTALAVSHSATNVTHLVPHSSSMAIAVPAMTITNTKQQVMGGTTLVPVSLATMTAATPVSITTGTPVSIATVSMAPMQMPPVMSVPASLEQTSVLYPILTQMCTK